MDCSYHQEFSKRFMESGWSVGWAKSCDIMGCFYFHPETNPEFFDKPENADYIKKHRVFVRKDMTKLELGALKLKRKGAPSWKKEQLDTSSL